MKSLDEIVHRKQALIARCAGQRARLADVFRELERPIAIADRALAVVRFFRAHPLLLSAAIAAGVALKRGGPVGLVGRSLAAWRIWRGIANFAGRLGIDFARRRQGKGGHVAS